MLENVVCNMAATSVRAQCVNLSILKSCWPGVLFQWNETSTFFWVWVLMPLMWSCLSVGRCFGGQVTNLPRGRDISSLHQHYGMSNHWQYNCLFTSLYIQVNNKETPKLDVTDPFFRRVHIENVESKTVSMSWRHLVSTKIMDGMHLGG